MLTKTLQDLFQRYRRPGDIVFAVLFLAFALFMAWQLPEQTQVVKRTKWFAQPALWPKVAVWSMVVFGALHLLGSVLSPRIPGRWRELAFWLQSFEYVLYFLIYVTAVPWLGYLPATVIFALFLAFRAGFRKPSTLGLVAIFGVIIPIIFRGLLQVKIPAGAWYSSMPQGPIRDLFLLYL